MKKSWKIMIALTASLLIISVGVASKVNKSLSENSRVYEFSFKLNERNFTTDDIKKIVNKGYNISFMNERLAMAKTFRTEKNVEVTETNENYQYITNRQLSAGSWFNDIQVKKNINVAVVNENTALNFFGTVNAVSNQIIIDGIEYEVVGVVKDGQNKAEIYISANVMDNKNNVSDNYKKIWLELKNKSEQNLLLKIMGYTKDEINISEGVDNI